MSTSDQKLYTEFWVSPLSFCLWLDGIDSRFLYAEFRLSALSFCLWPDGIDSRFKSHLDNKSKERFYNQRVREYKCRRTKTVDKDILITHRFSDRKFS